MDLEELKKELIHEIQATDDGEVLARVQEILCGVEATSLHEPPLTYGTAKELKPYTIEELKERVRNSEEDEGIEWKDFVKELKEEFPWLRG